MKAKQIKELRTSLGLTQAQFAKKLAVSISSVVNWEKGKGEPREASIEALKALAAKGGGKAAEGGTEAPKRRGRPPGSGKGAAPATAPTASATASTAAGPASWAGIGKFARTIGQLVKSDGLDPSQLEQMLNVMTEAQSSGLTLENLIELCSR